MAWSQIDKDRPGLDTGAERDFADEDPSGGEEEAQLDKLADAVVQLDADVARILKDAILHGPEADGIAGVDLAADAEVHLNLREDLCLRKQDANASWKRTSLSSSSSSSSSSFTHLITVSYSS